MINVEEFNTFADYEKYRDDLIVEAEKNDPPDYSQADKLRQDMYVQLIKIINELLSKLKSQNIQNKDGISIEKFEEAIRVHSFIDGDDYLKENEKINELFEIKKAMQTNLEQSA